MYINSNVGSVRGSRFGVKFLNLPGSEEKHWLKFQKQAWA